MAQANRKNGMRKLYSKARRKLRERVLERDGHRCVYCGETENLTMGHKIAVTHGGVTKLDNLQTECYDCNHGKGSDYVEVTN